MSIALLSGMKLTPARLNALTPMYREKTADQPKTNNTLANDTHLFCPVEANATYTFEFVLLHGTATSNTPDFKAALTFPSGCTADWSIIGLDTATGGTFGNLSVNAWQGSTTSGASISRGLTNSGVTMSLLRGRLKVGVVAGTLQLQWAQATTTAETTTLYAGSHLLCQRVD